MSKQTDAEAMWASLRDALTNVEEAIKSIVAAKAWKPLGYETFAEAWDARMKGASLANSIKPYVIYAMLDEALDVDDVVRATGWGTDQVRRAAEDHHIGVPVQAATVIRSRPRPWVTQQPPVRQPGTPTIVRQHERAAPSEPRTIHVTLAGDEYARLRELADARGMDLEDEAKRAILAHFRRIESPSLGAL